VCWRGGGLHIGNPGDLERIGIPVGRVLGLDTLHAVEEHGAVLGMLAKIVGDGVCSGSLEEVKRP
jgi:hypothetical protein